MLWCHVMKLIRTQFSPQSVGARCGSSHPLSLSSLFSSAAFHDVKRGVSKKKGGQLVTANTLREKPSLLSLLINIPSCEKDKCLLGWELHCWSGWHCPSEDHMIRTGAQACAHTYTELVTLLHFPCDEKESHSFPKVQIFPILLKSRFILTPSSVFEPECCLNSWVISDHSSAYALKTTTTAKSSHIFSTTVYLEWLKVQRRHTIMQLHYILELGFRGECARDPHDNAEKAHVRGSCVHLSVKTN